MDITPLPPDLTVYTVHEKSVNEKELTPFSGSVSSHPGSAQFTLEDPFLLLDGHEVFTTRKF